MLRGEMRPTVLERKRKERNLSVVELRNLAGVDDKTLRSQEKRKPVRKVHNRVRRAIAGALGVDWQELYTLDGYVK